MEINLILSVIFTYMVNLPFGYWRKGVSKFSFQWFLAIHAPVPIVIFIRFFFELGFELYTYPLMVGAFFLGQYTGCKYRVYRQYKT